MPNQLIQEIAKGAAERIRQFLDARGLETEVVVLIAPRFAPRSVCCATTADEEAANTMMHHSITDDRIAEDDY